MKEENQISELMSATIEKLKGMYYNNKKLNRIGEKVLVLTYQYKEAKK